MIRTGYPCINRSIEGGSTKTFRLASYSPARMKEAIEWNVNGLFKMLEFNREHGLLAFRLSSQLIPFASHPVCTYPWRREFRAALRMAGDFARRHGMRLSMHPDQFTLINSPGEEIFERTVAELTYHAAVLDALEVEESHKVQIHVGGVYGDKTASIGRFLERFRRIPKKVTRRLAIENDDRLYSLADCLTIHAQTGLPVVFDVFHHQLNGAGEDVPMALDRAARTWEGAQGPLMCDYSSQQEGSRAGTHAGSIDAEDFRRFAAHLQGRDADLMLEIKDKEQSALVARDILRELNLGD